MREAVRIPDDANARHIWKSLSDDLESLGGKFRQEICHPRNVPAGMRQARHVTYTHGIAVVSEYYRDRLGCLSRRLNLDWS